MQKFENGWKFKQRNKLGQNVTFIYCCENITLCNCSSKCARYPSQFDETHSGHIYEALKHQLMNIVCNKVSNKCKKGFYIFINCNINFKLKKTYFGYLRPNKKLEISHIPITY